MDWVDAARMTFGVGGEKRRFSVDLMPRVISPHEWQAPGRGPDPARPGDRDLPARTSTASSGSSPTACCARELLEGSPGWRPEATRLPAGTVRAPVMGFDLVRNEFGGWRVLEDNVRNPSGAAYAIAIRDLMNEVLPDLPRPDGLLRPGRLPCRCSGRCLLDHAQPDGTVALLSSGPGASAWFEHQLLAERGGLLLLTADDLTVRRRRGTASRDRHPDRRPLSPTRRRAGRPDRLRRPRRSAREIFAVAEAGGVFLANAPGNGVADDKAMYCYVPELIALLPGRAPEPGVGADLPDQRRDRGPDRAGPDRRAGDQAGGRARRDRRADRSGLLRRPRLRSGGRRSRPTRPAGWPRRWSPCPPIPTVSGTHLQPRHVDLRAFVYVRGTAAEDCTLADLALTRVAPEGSLVVNSSRGGGAKDTWIIGEPERRRARRKGSSDDISASVGKACPMLSGRRVRRARFIRRLCEEEDRSARHGRARGG